MDMCTFNICFRPPWDETFVPKSANLRGGTVLLGPQFPPRHRRWRQKFKILGPGDQYSGVWYHTFRLRRPQIRGFASYIWAPKPEFSGGNGMRARSLYSGVLS